MAARFYQELYAVAEYKDGIFHQVREITLDWRLAEERANERNRFFKLFRCSQRRAIVVQRTVGVRIADRLDLDYIEDEAKRMAKEQRMRERCARKLMGL